MEISGLRDGTRTSAPYLTTRYVNSVSLILTFHLCLLFFLDYVGNGKIPSLICFAINHEPAHFKEKKIPPRERQRRQ